VHAAESEVDGKTVFSMDAFVASLDGARFLRARMSGSPADSIVMASSIVDDLRSQGAEEILKELR
jgi:porphobilinogen deaminase